MRLFLYVLLTMGTNFLNLMVVILEKMAAKVSLLKLNKYIYINPYVK